MESETKLNSGINSGLETALNIVNLVNAATPGVANLIILARHNNGTMSVITILDEADEQFDRNIDMIRKRFESRKAGE